MRDYKNVKVPRSYRSTSNRGYVKRVEGGRGFARTGKSSGGVDALLKFAMVLLLAACGVLCWLGYETIMHSDTFVVSGADIKGVKHMNEASLRDIVGDFKGRNIFRIDLEAAAGRARAYPWVKEVRIHRSMPNRITMAIVERTPSMLFDTGTARYLMDDEGVIIERIAKEQQADWPLPVVFIKDYKVRPGDQITAEALPEAIQLLAEIAARGGWQAAQVTIKASSPDALSIVYAEHEFKIGNGRYPEKLRRLAEVMADVQQRRIEIAYVDLRPEHQAAVMVKKNSGKFKVQSAESRKKRR